jgi:hypothetical protein
MPAIVASCGLGQVDVTDTLDATATLLWLLRGAQPRRTQGQHDGRQVFRQLLQGGGPTRLGDSGLCRAAPVERSVSCDFGAEETRVEASFCAAITTAKEQKSVFARETRRSNLRGIRRQKSERVRRTWIPTASLLTSRRGIASLLAFKFIYELIKDSEHFAPPEWPPC